MKTPKIMKKLLLVMSFMGSVILGYGQSFISVWKTDNTAGEALPVSTNNQIKLPITGTSYSGSWVKVGEPAKTGTFSTPIANNIIDFGEPGTFEVTISTVSANIAFAFGNNPANSDCKKLIEIKQWGNLWTWKTPHMLYGCENLEVTATDIPLLSGNISNMFLGCSKLTGNASFSDWETTAVTNMTGLFREATLFNQPINTNGAKWNTSNVTNTSGMFLNAKAFNQNIGNWDVSKVINASSMFQGAEAFNQDLSSWTWGADPSVITIGMNNMFRDAKKFNTDISGWNTSKVINMSSMFYGAEEFNQPLNTSADNEHWNVSAVTNMNSMLRNAKNFNQPLDKWNVSAVTDMAQMFRGASVGNPNTFNQSLAAWVLNEGITNAGEMLSNSGMDANNYNATLIGWAANIPTRTSATVLGVTNLTYTTQAAKEARDAIIAKGWTLTGDIDGTTLPVTFANLKATLSNGELLVKWQTISEQNNDKFIIKVSKDGVNWEEAATVNSKAENGNSNEVLDYAHSIKYSTLQLAGVPVLLTLLLAVLLFSRRKRLFISMALVTGVFAIGSCAKEAALSLQKDAEKEGIYVKVTQIDKDGKTSSDSGIFYVKKGE